MLVGRKIKIIPMYATPVISGYTRSVLLLLPSFQLLLITITLSLLSSQFLSCIVILVDYVPSAINEFNPCAGLITVTNAHFLCIFNVRSPQYLWEMRLKKKALLTMNLNWFNFLFLARNHYSI
ncbi:hypothetical protein AgCh_019218 [Apium graveolens]